MKRTPFTLIEMLVVLGITGILLALAIPAFEKLVLGQGVNGAATMVSSQLRLARAYAIASRQRVAVLLPGADAIAGTPTVGTPTTLKYKSLAFCTVDANNNFGAPVPNTKIEYLPTGAVIAEVNINTTYQGSDVDVLALSTDITVKDVKWSTFGFATTSIRNCRGIVLKPTGALALASTVPWYIRVVEGEPNGTALVIRNAANQLTLEVNPYTGRAAIKD